MTRTVALILTLAAALLLTAGVLWVAFKPPNSTRTTMPTSADANYKSKETVSQNAGRTAGRVGAAAGAAEALVQSEVSKRRVELWTPKGSGDAPPEAWIGLDEGAVFGSRSEPEGPGPDVLAESHPISLSDRTAKARKEVADAFAAHESAIREGAENGDPQAQWELGIAYLVGLEGLPRDFYQAHLWFLRASENGHDLAPVSLGRMLQDGYGVEHNPEEAVKWYRIAMERGNSTGAYELAGLYEKGEYQFPADPKKAVDLYRQAARDGSLSSAFRLGQFYYYGWPVDAKDYREAAKWFERSVETHYFPAYRYLATIYTEERGSAYDPVEGLKWLIVDDATDLMPQYLKDRNDKLRATLRPDQIGEAERRAATWLEAHKQ